MGIGNAIVDWLVQDMLGSILPMWAWAMIGIVGLIGLAIFTQMAGRVKIGLFGSVLSMATFFFILKSFM